jgi:hypothetical protein
VRQIMPDSFARRAGGGAGRPRIARVARLARVPRFPLLANVVAALQRCAGRCRHATPPVMAISIALATADRR